MKPTIPAFSLLLFIASCSPYQYLTFDAEKATKDRDKNIIWESDSIKLVYHFSQPGKLDITAFNKTGEPVYINWKKSAIIHKGRSVSLYDQNAQVTGNITTDAGNTKEAPRTSTINAAFNIPEGMDFMPPKSYISKAGIDVSPALTGLAKLDENLPAQKMKDGEGNKVSYRTRTYDPASSPLKFRLYFTLGIGNEGKEFAIEHLFYVSELIETANGSQAVFIKENEGDKLYTRINAL
jgi:hypothetical protein